MNCLGSNTGGRRHTVLMTQELLTEQLPLKGSCIRISSLQWKKASYKQIASCPSTWCHFCFCNWSFDQTIWWQSRWSGMSEQHAGCRWLQRQAATVFSQQQIPFRKKGYSDVDPCFLVMDLTYFLHLFFQSIEMFLIVTGNSKVIHFSDHVQLFFSCILHSFFSRGCL